MRTFINLKNWTWTTGKYPLEESEAKELMPVLARNQAKAKNKFTDRAGCACPSCGGDVANVDVFCRWCGQRFEKEES